MANTQEAPTKLTVACVQNCATPDVAFNIARTLELTQEAVHSGAELVCLPEYFSGLRTNGGRIDPAAFPEGEHPALPAFQDEARRAGIWVLLGSLGISAPNGRTLNRSYLIDAGGHIRARYDKIHMFDVDLGEGKSYRESATIAPGDEAVVAATPWGDLGLSICYDLRFAGLYRSLAQSGASLLTVPAAFTKLTGEAHWHVLNQARAIENGCFVIAPCQYGTLDGGAECYGHSLIVDPWGEILADGGDTEGVVVAALDLGAVARARERIPALTHDRAFTIPGRRVAAE
ncbi:MAG: carbon-nitrogen hydrolase family protein [Hyphomicrobiaceae bacterium]